MNIFNTSQTLYQVERVLEQQLKLPKNNVRILGDLPVSYEDYRYLLLKLRGLKRYWGDIRGLENFRLSVLTLWAFSLRYEKTEQGYQRIKSQLLGVPQHHTRVYINMLLNAFYEYELNVFHMDDEIQTMDGLMALLIIHTGIPDELQPDFCHLLDDSLVYGDDAMMEYRFILRMPQHMQRLYRSLHKEVVVSMLRDCRRMFLDYRQRGITRYEAYQKYPIMSSNLMKGCFDWCDRQETYVTNRLVLG